MKFAVVFLALVASLFSSALGQVFTHIVQNKLYNAVLKKVLLIFPQGNVQVDRSDCTWRGGDYGDDTSCNSGEVKFLQTWKHCLCRANIWHVSFFKIPVGSCGSGSDPDCENPDSDDDEYDMILCCSLSGKTLFFNEGKYNSLQYEIFRLRMG